MSTSFACMLIFACVLHRPWCLEKTSYSLVELLRWWLIFFYYGEFTNGKILLLVTWHRIYCVTSNRDYKFQSRREIRVEKRRGILFDIVSNERTIRLRKRVKRIQFFSIKDFEALINQLSTNEATRDHNSLRNHARPFATNRIPKSRTELHHYFATMNSYNVQFPCHF